MENKDLVVMLEGMIADIDASKDVRGIAPEAVERFNKYLGIAIQNLPDDSFLKDMQSIQAVSERAQMGDFSEAKEKVRSRASELKTYLNLLDCGDRH